MPGASALFSRWLGEVGGFEGVDVAIGTFDAQPEQVGEAARIAAGGADFGEDAVFAEGLG